MIPNNQKVRTLWLSGGLHAFTHLYQIALIPLYLMIRTDLDLDERKVTLLVTVMGLVYYVPSYFIGILADKLSRKKLLAFGLALNGVGFVFLSFVHSYPLALVAVTIAGLGGSFYHPAGTALIARLYPKTTGKALGLVAIGASLGYFIGPIYSGWRSGSAHSWRAPVLEMGLFGILFAAVFFWLAVEVPGELVISKSDVPNQKMFPTRALWFFFLVGSFLFSLRDFSGAGMQTLSSLFLQQARGFTPQKTGVMLSAIFIASAISNPLFGRLSDKGRVRWATWLLAISFVAVIAFPHASPLGSFFVLMGFGFFFLASYPVVEAALMESVPDRVRGRVFGLFMTMIGILGNISHVVMGELVQKLGKNQNQVPTYFPLYYLLAGMLLLSMLGLPCLHAIRRREHLEPESSSKSGHPSTAALAK